jgi:hypothetical protein
MPCSFLRRRSRTKSKGHQDTKSRVGRSRLFGRIGEFATKTLSREDSGQKSVVSAEGSTDASGSSGAWKRGRSEGGALSHTATLSRETVWKKGVTLVSGESNLARV